MLRAIEAAEHVLAGDPVVNIPRDKSPELKRVS
jgi:hypothetical protein